MQGRQEWEFEMRKTVLVSGVAGFIGAAVARALLSEGYRVIGLDDLSSGREDNIPEGVDFVEADLTRPKLEKLIPGPVEKIFHLAGQSSGEISFEDPRSDLEKNTISTLNLIHLGINKNTERMIYASSMSVYGEISTRRASEKMELEPISCYGVSKLSSEQYLQIFSAQLPFVSLRMFNVYGPGQDLKNLKQGMVSIYLAQALDSGHIIVRGSQDRFRDFINIRDVVEIWLLASTSPHAIGQAINAGTGEKTSVAELISKIVLQIPSTTVAFEGSTPGDQTGIVADTTKLNRILGKSSFVGLDEGISEFAQWAKSLVAGQ